jgi:hypothetical protein
MGSLSMKRNKNYIKAKSNSYLEKQAKVHSMAEMQFAQRMANNEKNTT